jgi:hypothetical protein
MGDWLPVIGLNRIKSMVGFIKTTNGGRIGGQWTKKICGMPG